MRCTANRKNCPDCGYRFKRTDARYQDGGKCPHCGLGRRCRRRAVSGAEVCQVHGAGSPRKGRKSGRPSKIDIFYPGLPKRLARTYISALEDDRLYQLRHDIALLEARKMDLITRVDEGQSSKLWFDLKHAWSELIKAQKLGDREATKKWTLELHALIEKGYSDAVAWKEIQQTIEGKSRLLDKEFRHMSTAHQMISVEKLFVLADKIADAIQAHVSDDREKRHVLGEIFEALNAGEPTSALMQELAEPPTEPKT